jgi:hypothetical protein
VIDTVIVLAKEPRPGQVKTRLVPPLNHWQAAELAAAALRDTLDTLDAVAAPRRLLAFDGELRGWLPAGWSGASQVDGSLDARIVGAFASAGSGSAVLVGMDTPQLRADQVEAFDPTKFDACLGLARDGGYWAIGLRDTGLAESAVRGVPMSTSATGLWQWQRLRELGLRIQLLDELTDVDTMIDADLVADLTPGSGFAHAVADVRQTTSRVAV